MARAIPRLLLPAALLLSGTAFAEEPVPAPAAPPPAQAAAPPAPAPAPSPAPTPTPPQAAPKPTATSAPPAVRPLPPANPFGEIGAASLVGGTFSLGVLIGCAASNINPPSQSQCLLASGLTGVGLILVGVPLILVGRSRNVALGPRVTFVAQARGGVLGYSGSF